MALDVARAPRAVAQVARRVERSAERDGGGHRRGRQRRDGARAPGDLASSAATTRATFTLVAFGGAGGLHAAALAEALGMRARARAAPPGAALGVGHAAAPSGARLRAHASASCRRAVASRVRGSRGSSATRGGRSRREGVRVARRSSARSTCAMRGQAYEFAVPLERRAGARALRRARTAQRYGYADPTRAIEVVTLRAGCAGRRPRRAAEVARGRRGRAPRAGGGRCACVFGGRAAGRALRSTARGAARGARVRAGPRDRASTAPRRSCRRAGARRSTATGRLLLARRGAADARR